MPEYLWSREEGIGRVFALSPLLLLEGPYRLGATLHRASYRWFPRRRVRLPLAVLSVGNLAVGGSGKTPVVAWLARELHARGRKVAILSRGVSGARGRWANVLSDGERLLLGPADVGDEPVWLASQLPGIPVLAGRNRAALGYRAAALFGADLLILDDGFQHHRLERDLDLVCLDAELGLGNGHVLPRGPLRESRRVLRRAHALLWTRSPEGFTPPLRVDGVARFSVPIRPQRLRPLGGGPPRPLEWLSGQRVGLLAAIARPDRLQAQLDALGAEVATARTLPDHHVYRREDVASLDPDLPWITTAKDAVKIPHDWLSQRTLLILDEVVRPEEPERLVDWITRRLAERRPELSP